MPEEGLTIKLKGMDKLLAAFEKFPNRIARNMRQAGDEAAKRELLRTKGLQNYPPATSANMPPTPYYIRGRGMQYQSGNVGGSERLGTQWTVRSRSFRTEVSNRASYARWVHGEDQAGHMAKIGWKKLLDVAKNKLSAIRKVYQAWVDKTIRDLGL